PVRLPEAGRRARDRADEADLDRLRLLAEPARPRGAGIGRRNHGAADENRAALHELTSRQTVRFSAHRRLLAFLGGLSLSTARHRERERLAVRERAGEVLAAGELDEAVVERVVERDVAADLLFLLAADVADDHVERAGGVHQRREAGGIREALG